MRRQTLRYEGDAAVGREAIISKLQSVAQMHSGFKVEHEVEDVQCQPLGFVSGTGGEIGLGERDAAACPGAREG